MARFNAITLEQYAIKREKIERRRGPKPVRASLLWAQTSWLQAKAALCDGRLCFQSDAHTWNFDGALLESTKRALDKLSLRTLAPDEVERLHTRQQQWHFWNECSSLENIALADLRSRFVLESLFDEPMTPSAAREVARLPQRLQNVLLSELQTDIFPARTQNLARWLARNRHFEVWQRNASFPVNLACRLGLTGEVVPAIFQSEGVLALNVPDIIALLDSQTPCRVGEVAEFWCDARWLWPSLRPLSVLLKPSHACALGRDWRELELKWHAKWRQLWHEMAVADLEAARCALQFHELLMDQKFAAWQPHIYKSSTRAAFLLWFDATNAKAFELIKMLSGQSHVAPLFDLAGELWIEYGESQTEGFWNDIVVPTLSAACLLDVPTARELRAQGHLHLARRFAEKPELFRLALEWMHRDEGLAFVWQLARLPSNAKNASFLRREAELFFAFYERFPTLEATTRGELWDHVLPGDEERALDLNYWRLIRALAPLFISKICAWHADNASNLRDWWTDWVKEAGELGWSEAELLPFCETMLAAIEREFKVLEAAPLRLDGIEGPLQTFAYLSKWAGEPSEQVRQRCDVLMTWLAHGKSDRTDDWWESQGIASKLKRRPRLCVALLLVSKRSPGFVREVLPQVEALRRLHLTAELDQIEEALPLLFGELSELEAKFPDQKTALATLARWQTVAQEEPRLPSSVRDLLAQEEKWARETDFLRSRLLEKPNEHLQTRLANLERRLENGGRDVESEVAQALEIAVELAISSGTRALVTHALQGRLRFLCGSVVDQLEWSDDWANALLIACEIDDNRKWATKLLRGQSQNPSGWQRHIPANQKWLDEFAAQGKNRQAFESVHGAQIGEWELWIERDALQILHMGNRFSTCLSRGGCNSHSTIANALDANKLVVYARRDGQIQARQLWVVTSEWKLGGFHIYANLSEKARAKSGVELAFREFAQRFAGQCGLELNEGADAEIPEVCGARWYNDGLISWAELKGGDEKSSSCANRPKTSSRRRTTTKTRTSTEGARRPQKTQKNLSKPLTTVRQRFMISQAPRRSSHV